MSRYPLRQTVARILSREDRLLTYGIAPRKGRFLEVGEGSKGKKSTKMGDVEPISSQPPIPQPLTIQTSIDIGPYRTLGELHEAIEEPGQISFPLGERGGQSDGLEQSIALDIGGEELALLKELKGILPIETPPELEQFTIGEVTEMFQLGITSNSAQNRDKSVNAHSLSTDPSLAHSIAPQQNSARHELSSVDIYQATEHYAYMFEPSERVEPRPGHCQ